LWDSVELKSGGDYVIAIYSSPNISIRMKFGSLYNFKSKDIPLPGHPDMGQIRLFSREEAPGKVTNILEVPLVDGRCRGARFILDKTGIRETQFVECHGGS